jgi:hypothetical protein
MPAPRRGDSVSKVVAAVDGLRQEVRAMARTPQLPSSSIDDGAMLLFTDGALSGSVGTQYDGTTGAFTLNGPIPPHPSAPTLKTAAGGVLVSWDGVFPSQAGFTDPVVAPQDFKGIEIHVSPDPALAGNSFATLVGPQMTSARGFVDQLIPWDTSNTPLYARLVTRAESGRASAASPVTGPVESGIVVDGVAPDVPTALTVGTYVAQDATGRDDSHIVPAWTAPGTNATGTALKDLSHYIVEWKPTARTAWSTMTSSATTADIPVGAVGQEFQVRVAAVDKQNNVSGYSTTATVVSGKDTVAPAAPSTPTLTNWIGILKVTWDGKMVGGAAPPADLNVVEVHASTSATFTPSPATLMGSLSPGGGTYPVSTPYGALTYVKLVAVDFNGNASVPSAAASGTTSKLVGDDIFEGAVGSSKLADLAVVSAKIADLAVNDAKITDLSVAKLTTGVLTADVVISGRFATASTGARMELNSIGLQKFAADGRTLLVNISGTEALLTGQYKTATTGRRIEMGASGSVGLIEFWAPDGQLTFIKAYTEPDARAIESIQVGVDKGGHYLWNRVNINDREEIRADAAQINLHIAPTANAAARFSVNQYDSKTSLSTGFRQRLLIDSGGTTLSAATGGGSAALVSNAGISNQSPRLSFGQADGGGTMIKSLGNWLEVRNTGDSVFHGVKASVFEVSSDRAWKSNIVDADLDGPATVRAMRMRKYTVKRPKPDGDLTEDVEEIGLVAQEAPPVVVGRTAGSDGTFGIDVYQYIGVHTLTLQQILTRLERLEAAIPPPRPGAKP